MLRLLFLCALIISLPIGEVSAAPINQNPTINANVTPNVIINNYRARVGLTQVLTGSSYSVASGGSCAVITFAYGGIAVRGVSSGTIVVYAYSSAGVLLTINSITFY